MRDRHDLNDMVMSAQRLVDAPSLWDAHITPFDERAQYDLTYDFIRAVAPDYAVPYDEYFAQYPDWDVYAMIMDGKIAARAAILRRYAGALEVAAVATHPDYRNRGMSAALVGRLARTILARGQVPTLTTRAHNAPMRAAAKKAGFFEIGAWYHGSPLTLHTLRAGSTITPFEQLAEAFSHKPTKLSIGDDGRICHNGILQGTLYAIDEEIVPGRDMLPHPRSTMGAEKEWITERPLRLRLIRRC